MIEHKGTSDSLDLFKGVELNNEPVDYNIFENWAIRRARFGATGSRSYVELKLDEEALTATPSLVEIVDSTADASVSDLLIPVTEIYKQSQKNTNKNVFPIITEKDTDTSLPTAGFVNPNDVDIAAIDIAAFVMADGRRVSVLNGWGKGKEGTFLKAARDAACESFTTVMSPDYNAEHNTHFHLDQGTRWAMVCR